MPLIDFFKLPVEQIVAFQSAGAWTAEVACGRGDAHIHVVKMNAGGTIGPHEAGFCQLFLVMLGTGWLEGKNGRVELAAGQGAFVSRGEMHSKGASSELTALIVQVSELAANESVGLTQA